MSARNTSAASSSRKGASGWRAWMRRPVAFYLVCLILAAVIPAFIFAIIVANRSNEAQERVREALLKTSTGAVNRAVEREVSSLLSTLTFFSTSDYLLTGDLRNLQDQAQKALAGTNTYLIVIGHDYGQRLNTRVPFGTDLGPTSDRISAERAFVSGTTAVSSLFFGQTAQTWVFNVYMPVTLASGERVLLALTEDAQSMAATVNGDILAPGWNAAVLDDAGHVIVATDPVAAVGAPFFLNVVPSPRIGLGTARHQGADYQVVTDFSPLTGWRIVAWAKMSDVQAPATSSLVWLTVGGAVFAALAAVAALLIAQAVSRDVRLLTRDAMRLGLGESVPPRRHAIAELDTVSKALCEAAEARARAEGEIRFLMREVAHRSKNQLTVIQAMLNQSASAADSATAFAEAFRKRVAGLARSTDLMIANAAQGVELAELAGNQLSPFVPDNGERARISGPSVRLDSQGSQTLGMALHELATNAVKYGAFANDRGIVEFSWSVEGDRLALVWREREADIDPGQAAAARKGFGSVVLERMLGMALEARLERLVHADGIEWRMSIPLSRLRNDAATMADGDGQALSAKDAP